MTEFFPKSLKSDQFDSIASSCPVHSSLLEFDFVHAERLGKRAIVVHNTLSEEECVQLTAFIDDHDRPPSYEGEVTMVAASPILSHRNNQRMCVSSEALGSVLIARLGPLLSSLDQDILVCNEDNKHLFLNRGFGMRGQWVHCGINPHFRLCKYPPGGHFGPHFDSDHVVDPMRKRSLKTVMVYLNDSYEGGETNFVESHALHKNEQTGTYCAPDCCVFASVKARRGDCLVFDHPLLHEGGRVSSGYKYLLRSELMFEKSSFETAVSEQQQQEEERQERALSIFLAGTKMEENGEVDAAIQKYRLAFKICPDIEDAYS